MISRMMLNLRDPSLVPAPEHTAMEDVPDLTIVESYYPSELSFRGGLEDHDSSQDGVHHRSEREHNSPVFLNSLSSFLLTVQAMI